MIAETGSIEKVSGSRSETPLGAPSPGRTPTSTPSSTPAIISRTWCVVSATEKPCIRLAMLSMLISPPSQRPMSGSIGPLSRPIWKNFSSAK